MIKNIIFDIGNVLIDYDPTSYMKGFGFSLEKEKRIKETVFDGPLWQELDRSIMPFEQIRREFAALTTPKDREDLLRVFDSSYQTVHKRDSAIPWIRSMQERGFETYYLSNYSDWMLNLTQDALDFLPLMRGGLFSCEVGLRKPEPEIYQAFLNRFPQIQPEESVFIDDVPENIAAARAFGLHGIVFQDQTQVMRELDDLIINISSH